MHSYMQNSLANLSRPIPIEWVMIVNIIRYLNLRGSTQLIENSEGVLREKVPSSLSNYLSI